MPFEESPSVLAIPAEDPAEDPAKDGADDRFTAGSEGAMASDQPVSVCELR